MDVIVWEESFVNSCQRLGLKCLDALLLHSSEDLRKPGSIHLVEWLLSLRERGLVKRLGLSIYSSHDLEGVSSSILDLVQLPLSLFDQRLLQDGTISYLQDRGVSLFARSVYLQGLLLLPANNWPRWINNESRLHQKQLEVVAANRNCQLIDLALGFIRAQEFLEGVVIGICSITELEQLYKSWMIASPWKGKEWQGWAIQETVTLDPRCWPS